MADTHAKHHDYHLLNPSPWPIIGSVAALFLAVGLIVWMKSMHGGAGVFGIKGPWLFGVGVMGVLYTMFMWWRDVIKEAYAGDHTPVVQLHLRYGMIMFIASEVMFFVAWFWAFFDAALFPAGIEPLANSKELIGMVERNALTGGIWPPKPSENFTATFDAWGLPLVNTLVLLLSGTTVTWAHHALLENKRKGLIWGLTLTVHPRRPLHGAAGLRVRPRRIPLQRPHLRRDVLHGDGLPRRPCPHRHDLPHRLPDPRAEGALHAQAALRLRSRSLVLALRRRRLAVPVRLRLRVGGRRAGATLIGPGRPQLPECVRGRAARSALCRSLSA